MEMQIRSAHQKFDLL